MSRAKSKGHVSEPESEEISRDYRDLLESCRPRSQRRLRCAIGGSFPERNDMEPELAQARSDTDLPYASWAAIAWITNSAIISGLVIGGLASIRPMIAPWLGAERFRNSVLRLLRPGADLFDELVHRV